MSPLQNHLLAALPPAIQQRLFPMLELVPLPLGKVLYESGDTMRYVYFPTDSIVSLLYVMESGASGPATTGKPGSVGFGQIMQGYIEASNVDAVSEITALIVAQRAYEMNSKVISTADEMLQAANQVKA